jgi:1-acyl-sn-glycerol-3-phosphate acyltransferase
MVKLLRRLYSYWALLLFLVGFFALYPFFYLFLQSKKTFQAAHFLNKIWTYWVFSLCLVPIVIVRKTKLKKGQAYMFCANHCSYADIPLMYVAVNVPFSFIGKSSLGKVPLFGYMYRTLHILVDRKSKDSKYQIMVESYKRIDQNESIVIFPEGTIGKHPPEMLEFKEGAFKMAIEKQIPIVPVTIPNNWLILRDDGKWLCQWKPYKAIVHEPIETTGMTSADILQLKTKTQNIIAQQLKLEHPTI